MTPQPEATGEAWLLIDCPEKYCGARDGEKCWDLRSIGMQPTGRRPTRKNPHPARKRAAR